MNKVFSVEDSYCYNGVFVKPLTDIIKINGRFHIVEEVDTEDYEDIVFMTVQYYAHENDENSVEDVFQVEATYAGFNMIQELCCNMRIQYKLPEEQYLCVPIGPVNLYMCVENPQLLNMYLKHFVGARFITKSEYEDSVSKVNGHTFYHNKKIVCVSNFDRETVNDTLMATGVYCNVNPNTAIDCFNDELAEDFYKLVDADYKLYVYEP